MYLSENKTKSITKFFFLLVMACLLFAGTVQIEAATTYRINGVNVRYDDFSSSPNECWAYANNVYNKIWGKRFNSSFNDNSNSLRNLNDSQLKLTPDHLKSYVSNAACGSVLRICNSEYLHGSDGWGHSQIIVKKDSNGFTVFQGGLSSAPYKNERYYTWSEYCKIWSYSYIKYIKWPGAAAYSTDTVKPTIKNSYYSEVKSTSFRLCVVPKDNVGIAKVRMATWTTYDQSDIKWVDAWSNGCGTWFYDFNRNDFKNKNHFITHTYVYDAAGNYCVKETTYTYNTLPQANYESAEGGNGTVAVRGWAYDPDSPSKALYIDIYIGGPAGTGEKHRITADRSRSDVHNAFKCGMNHGFSSMIQTNKRGTQVIYAYAVDANTNTSRSLGTKTVTISSPAYIEKLSSLSKGFYVKWSKPAVEKTGYQIQCSTSSKFTAGMTKTYTIKNNKAAAANVKKLSGKRKYYVRIRTYRTYDGVNYYSAWSSAKSVTTKK